MISLTADSNLHPSSAQWSDLRSSFFIKLFDSKDLSNRSSLECSNVLPSSDSKAREDSAKISASK